MMRVAPRLEQIDHGTVETDRAVANGMPSASCDVAGPIQCRALGLYKTVTESLAFSTSSRGFSDLEVDDCIYEALEVLLPEQPADRNPSQSPDRQRQKIAFDRIKCGTGEPMALDCCIRDALFFAQGDCRRLTL